MSSVVEEECGDLARIRRPSRSLQTPVCFPLAMWMTLTTTAAAPGHLKRLAGVVDVAAVVADPAQSSWCGCRLGRWYWWRSAREIRRAGSGRRRVERSGLLRRHLPVALSVSVHAASPCSPNRGWSSPTTLTWPPNGGLPTMASKPGLARSKTSGNSICQWKGARGGSAWRRSSSRRRWVSALPLSTSAARPRVETFGLSAWRLRSTRRLTRSPKSRTAASSDGRRPIGLAVLRRRLCRRPHE